MTPVPGQVTRPTGESAQGLRSDVVAVEKAGSRNPVKGSIRQTLSVGGSVQMALQATFWAERFAMLTDRFGVPWMINFDGDSQAA